MPEEQTYETSELGLREKEDLAQRVDDLTEEVKKWRDIAKTLRTGGTVPQKDLDELNASEVTKRAAELKRLKQLLKIMVDKVNNADPSLPLEPQLGFDSSKIA